MEILNLFSFNGHTHRLLAQIEERSLIINCVKLTMPIWVSTADIEQCALIEEADWLSAQHISDIESLSQSKKKQAHERYTKIAHILPFITDDYLRSRLIEQTAKQYQISKQTVRKYLCMFLAYQTIGALVSTAHTEKKALSKDEKNFRWAINKYYYSSLKHSLKGTYLLMLKERYTTTEGVLMEHHTAFHRFKYFFNKTKKLQSVYIARDGLSHYQRNHRPLLGEGVREFASSIGIGMLDSTILDIYLINDEGKLVGRPILTACVDAYSGLCCGYALTWEGGVFSLRCLFDNIITDKVEHCRTFGIHIAKEDWNCQNMLPSSLVTDKGKEYTSYLLEQLTDLGVTLINLPPYRPDLKSYVEQFFNIIQNLYKPYLKGKGVVESDFNERGVTDYRKSACLTMRELETIIIKCIVYYNTKRVVESFSYTDSSMQPFSNRIWNASLGKAGANMIAVSKEQLQLTMLPRSKARFSRKGLVFNKLRYHSDGYTEQYLRGDDCFVAYNPSNTSQIWLLEEGDFIAFSLIDSRYDNQSFEEANNRISKQRSFLNSFNDESTQAQITLINDIQSIAENHALYTEADLHSVRRTRSREKNKQRSKG